jgi:hypothetical protein
VKPPRAGRFQTARKSGEGWLKRNGTPEAFPRIVVHVLAVDRRGRYMIPFRVVFRDGRWWNARTGEQLDAVIVGWRRVRDGR